MLKIVEDYSDSKFLHWKLYSSRC